MSGVDGGARLVEPRRPPCRGARRRRARPAAVTEPAADGDRDRGAGGDAEAVEVVRGAAAARRRAARPASDGGVLHERAVVVELAGGDQAQGVGVDRRAPSATAPAARR